MKINNKRHTFSFSYVRISRLLSITSKKYLTSNLWFILNMEKQKIKVEQRRGKKRITCIFMIKIILHCGDNFLIVLFYLFNKIFK